MGSDFEEEEDRFFDASEELCSGSGFSGDFDTICDRIVDSGSECLGYEVWTKRPDSITDRRRTFMESTGLRSLFRSPPEEELPETTSFSGVGLHKTPKSSELSISNGDSRNGSESGETTSFNETGLHQTTKSSELLISNGDSRNGSSASASSSQIDSSSSPDESTDEEPVHQNKNLVCKVMNSNDPTQYTEYAIEMCNDGSLGRLRELGSNRYTTLEALEETFSPRSEPKNEKKKNWIKKLSFKTSRNAPAIVKDSDHAPSPAMARIHVNASKKSFKEMSALHSRQDFRAHRGAILAIKFSSDGEFMASAGKDCVVRVWKVSECSKLDRERHILENDPSCLYYDQSSNVGALDVNREKLKRVKSSRGLARAILPEEAFWMEERPLHEFCGHRAEVLDLSWSKNGFLLSSSVDKTVRLWKVGSDGCQKIFSHKNYVTCVSFNPVDENYFISGSIDGMVRIWEISGCKVVDYVEVREIVTAVTYRPNGKKGIVGSISGNCYFLDFLDNRIRIGATVSLKGKKKKISWRITGFQFCPNDSRKVMVTIADSLIKVLYDGGVICKFKGPWKAGMHVSASFTSDGRHVVSTSEDSNVCVWSYDSLERAGSGPKKIQSRESFSSKNASIAIPWPGTMSTAKPPGPRIQRAQTVGEGNAWGRFLERKQPNETVSGSPKSAPQPDCFPLTRALFSESLPRGSGTWPEEAMMDSCPVAGGSNMWGVVIVTAGTDGRIRTYQNYGLSVRI